MRVTPGKVKVQNFLLGRLFKKQTSRPPVSRKVDWTGQRGMRMHEVVLSTFTFVILLGQPCLFKWYVAIQEEIQMTQAEVPDAPFWSPVSFFSFSVLTLSS